MKNKITVLGAGSFGTALVQVFTDNDYEVLLYTNIKKQKDEINNMKTNKAYYPYLIFSDSVRATTSLEEAMNFAEYVVIALPSGAIRELLKEARDKISAPKIFINVSKGIEPETNKLISEIITEELGKDKTNKKNKSKIKEIVILSGPSFAEEIIQRQVTALVVAAKKRKIALRVQRMISNKYIRAYTSNDILGVQIAGAFKNILALASGIISGMKEVCGENARAALLTRGLVEMRRYGKKKGAKKVTFIGLAGIGDLMLTANSIKSRNFRTGLEIGTGVSVKEAIKDAKTVVEGVRATEAVFLYAQKENLDMPITMGLYEVLFNNKDPKKVIEMLLSRELKDETLRERVVAKFKSLQKQNK